ncbi:MAG: hypothetical protein A4E63_00370 [Syntrophorhabdus sp. PtaU1.Bin050]|nr:MAG: hypothetical protein A4E63_00370 [Syntrophorhabdus sp. PtaU1.Bin050]
MTGQVGSLARERNSRGNAISAQALDAGHTDYCSREFPIDENRLFHVKMVRLKVEVITP